MEPPGKCHATTVGDFNHGAVPQISRYWITHCEGFPVPMDPLGGYRRQKAEDENSAGENEAQLRLCPLV